MLALVLCQALVTPVTLDEVRAATGRSVEVAIAEGERAEAQAARGVARAELLPHLVAELRLGALVSGPQRFSSVVPSESAPGSFRRELVDVPALTQGDFAFTLALRQRLFAGGRYFYELRRADALAAASDGAAAERRAASAFDGTQRFLRLWRAAATLEVLERAVARGEEHLGRARALFEAGRSQRRDVIDAELNLVRDRLARERQCAEIVAAGSELGAWLGRGDARLSPVAPPLPSLPTAPVERLTALALQRRPLLRALAAELRAREAASAGARAGWMPEVNAEVAYVRSATEGDIFFDPGRQHNLAASVTLGWTLFDGLRTLAATRAAAAGHAVAAAELERARRAIVAEVESAAAALEAQARVLQALEHARALAADSLRLARLRFDAGTGSTLEVRDAQLKLLDAEHEHVSASAALAAEHAALARAVGVAPGELP